MNGSDELLSGRRIAFFSMEVALASEIHTYSGGLGVLAGDMARSAADLGLPMIFVSLVSRDGYVRQQIGNEGRQVAFANAWNPSEVATSLEAMVAIRIGLREVWVQAWIYRLTSTSGHSVPVLLLDTDLEQNHLDDRNITDRLYGGDLAYRLKQEIVLGIGGGRILDALGLDIHTYHLNEGHAALLTLHLLKTFSRLMTSKATPPFKYDEAPVKERCIFTTHTPVEAAFDKFPYELVGRMLPDYIEIDEIKRFGGATELNMSLLALTLSGRVNGVSQRHAQTASRMFPGYYVRSITNGVHSQTWTHPAFQELFNGSFPHWSYEPEMLIRADQLPDELVWNAHQSAKRDLINLAKSTCGVEFDINIPLIAYSRRMTEYKRPDLLLRDLNRLRRIAHLQPFQIIFAGIAHPNDFTGQELIREINHKLRELAPVIRSAYIPNYQMRTAASIIAGADIWLNTPLPPLEASGTSGMKAGLNGVLNLSVLDGWWLEGHIEDVTGWSIGTEELKPEAHANDHEDLYRKLEGTVLPLYYRDRDRWIWMMKQAISKIGSYFSSTRALRRYASETYIR